MPSSSESKLNFYNQEGVKFTLRNKSRIKALLQKLFKREGRALGSVNYIFCTDEYLLKINKEFLNHDFYTDIISFEYSGKKELLEGEIYISIERVKENSKSLNLPFQTELTRVILHGALHFCGYKDKNPSQKREMTKKEDEYLKIY